MGIAIVASTQPGTADSTLYTGPTGGVILSHLYASNVTGSAATLTASVHRVLSGQTEPVCTALSIGASVMEDVINPAKLAYGGLRLDAGDTLHALASTAATITVTATT